MYDIERASQIRRSRLRRSLVYSSLTKLEINDDEPKSNSHSRCLLKNTSAAIDFKMT